MPNQSSPTEKTPPSLIQIFRNIYREDPNQSTTKSCLLLFLRIFVLIFAFKVFELAIMNTSNLEQDSYSQPVLIQELMKNLLGPQSFIFLIALVILIKSKTFWQPWSVFNAGAPLKWLITFIAIIMGWAYSTYDYNLFFNQTHYLDRIALIILVPLIYFRPIFVLPFLILLISIIFQFRYPFPGYSVAEQFHLVRILILFFATFVLQGLSGNKKINDFMFIAMTMMAASYFWPGFGKIRLNWIAHGHLYQLLFATYANGWLAFLDPPTLVTMGKLFSWFDWPMRIGTLILEVGALFALWRRSSLRVFLGGWALFHLGVFTMAGICFWKWVLLDTFLLILFLKNKKIKILPIFTRSHFAISILLIAGCKFWFNPVNLSWYDTRMNYSHRFQAITTSGETYDLHPYFFTPSEYHFSVSGLRYLSKEPRLRISWGVTWDPVIARELGKAKTAEDIFALESELGKVRYRENRIQTLDMFLIRYFRTLNSRGSQKTWLSPFRAPPQLWTFPRGNPYDYQEKIVKIKIFQVTTLFDGEEYLEIRKQQVHEVDIPLVFGTN